MAINIDLRDDNNQYSCLGYQRGAFVARFAIDFSEKNGTAGNVVAVANIPKGIHIQAVAVDVKTAQGATCTATVGDHTPAGDAVDADGWIEELNLNSATMQRDSAAAYSNNGKTYTTDSVLTLTLGHTTNAAKATVIICGFDLRTL